MRILAIRGANLASLERAFSLNFREEPLRSAGLFAITGPTGAGKSTILDAICLALYDKVPRLQRGKESGAYVIDASGERLSSADPQVLLRKGAVSGYAEIEFLGIDSREYRTRWEVHRAGRRPRGKLQGSRLSLHDVASGQCLANEAKGECLALIRDKLGLGFDQFTRAVLLAQGDFAKFLQAKTSEKAELLERLTNSAEYARISRAIYELHGRAQREVEDLIRELDLLRGISDEELYALRQDLEIRVGQLHELQEEERANVALYNQLLRYLEEKAAVREAQQQHALRQRSLAELAPDEELLARWDEAQSIREVAIEHAQKTKFLKDLQDELDRMIQAIQLTDSKYREAQSEMERHTAALEMHKTAGKELEQRLARAAVRGEGLRHVQRQIEERETEWKSCDAKRSGISQQRGKQQGDWEVLNREHTADRKRFAALDRGRALFDNDGAAIELLARYQQQKAAYSKHQIRIAQVVSKRLGCAADMELQLEQLKVLHGSIDPAVLALRQGLCAGEACPVCGATEHPFADRLNVHTIDQAEQDKQVERLVGQLEQLKQHGESLKEEEMQLHGAADQCAADIESLHRQIESMLASMSLRWAEKVEENPGWMVELRSAYQEWKKLREKVEQDALTLEHGAALLKSLQLQELEAVRSCHALLERLDALRQQCEAEQAELFSLLGGKSAKQLQEEFDGQRNELHRALQTAQAEERLVGAQQHDLMGRKNQLTAQQKQVLEEQVQLHAELEEWIEVHPRMGSVEALHDLLSISSDGVSAKRQAIQQAKMEAALSGQLLEAAQCRLAQYDEAELSQYTLQLLEDRKKSTTQELESIRSVTDGLRAGIAQEEDKRRRAAGLKSILLGKQENAEHWKRLNEMYGSADGARFRVMAQYYTLEALLRYANQHLGYIMPRYRIETIPTMHEANKRSLALQIVDTELLNEARPADTLSGGETFLVSLALSLALSAFTSSAYSIESLFIDEGFGSLDPESLGLALTALERLQTQGRKVGLISHVEEMNERIAVKVHVRKVGGGRSVVEV